VIPRSKLWNYVTVTGIAVIIWFWAAGATRESQEVFAQVLFAPGDTSANWIVAPSGHAVQLTIEGSNWALKKAETLLHSPLTIRIAPRSGPAMVDLQRELSLDQSLRDTGVRVTSCDPRVMEVYTDRRERFTLPVRANLGAVQSLGEIEVEPAEVSVIMPGLAKAQLPQQAAAEAAVRPEQLAGLTPGVRHTLTVPIVIPDARNAEGLVIDPTSARVTFMLRARTASVTLETVRVQMAGPRQDFDEYAVSFDDTLRDVAVTGDVDLIRRIGAGEVRVIAMLHLTANDKERAVNSKRISCFLALSTDGSIAPIEGRVAGNPELPEIDLQIKPRAAAKQPDAVEEAQESMPGSEGSTP
jgi:hypothetical protein